MKRNGRFGTWVLALLAAAALLFGAGIVSAGAAEPINVGFTSDFSGIAATYGVQEAPIVEMVVKEANAAGGINGRPINLIVQDNGSDPAKAIGNVKMFKEQYHCKIIIAGVTSSVMLALKSWSDKNQVPIVAIDGGTDKLWVKGKTWLMRTEVPASLRIHAGLARMKKLGITKVAFEGSTLAWGTDSLAVLKEKAPEYGIKVVTEILVEPKTKDLSIQAAQLKNSGAQALVCAEYEAETGVLARAMRAIGWKPYVFHVSAANYANTLVMYPGELFEGWETNETIDVTNPLVKKVWDKTKAYSGKTPIEDEKCPRTWDAIHLLLAALKASGNPEDATAVRDALYKNTTYERAIGKRGVHGGFTTDKNHLLNVEDIVPYVTRNGKLVPVH